MKYPDYFGYSYFKQYKDESNPRGYSQKSIVILSQHAHVQFYKQLLQIVTAECERAPHQVDRVFQKAYDQIQCWGLYENGKYFKLPLFDQVLTIRTPGNPTPHEIIRIRPSLKDQDFEKFSIPIKSKKGRK